MARAAVLLLALACGTARAALLGPAARGVCGRARPTAMKAAAELPRNMKEMTAQLRASVQGALSARCAAAAHRAPAQRPGRPAPPPRPWMTKHTHEIRR